MRQIRIKTIPHKQHRYETVGDYYYHRPSRSDPFKGWNISVSGMHNKKYEICVAVHELIEMSLCQARGIKNGDITKFDKQYEKERLEGKHGDEEPGFDSGCPCYKEHVFATKVEKMLAKEFGIDWETYDKTIMEL